MIRVLLMTVQTPPTGFRCSTGFGVSAACPRVYELKKILQSLRPKCPQTPEP